jgi:peptidoglycan/LPS O-acetylase OafA/YrhL
MWMNPCVFSRELAKLVKFRFTPELFSEKPGLVRALDFLRGISALSVCLAHYRNLLFVDLSAVVEPTIPVRVFYFFMSFAPQAVVVFFVISGFLVGGRAFVAIKTNQFNPLKYTVDRAVRLYVVLIPSILLTIVFLKAGFVTTESCTPSTDWKTIAGNLVFLQNLIVRPVCNNHPLWSLCNEATYYVLAPLVLLALYGRDKKWLLFPVAALLLLIVWFDEFSAQGVLIGFCIWSLGILPWFVRLNVSAVSVGTAFVAILILTRIHIISNEIFGDFLIASSLTATFCSRWPKKIGAAGSLAKIGAFGASFSYSLYLVHMPIAEMFASFLHGETLDPASGVSYLIYFSSVGAIVLVALMFGFFFEQRTQRIRDRVLGLHDGRALLSQQGHAQPQTADR